MTRKEFLRLTSLTGAAAAAGSSFGIAADASRGGAAANGKSTPVAGTTNAVVSFTTTPPGFGDDVLAQAKRCLIDGFGVVLAGSTVRGSEIVREYVNASGGAAEATILGFVRPNWK